MNDQRHSFSTFLLLMEAEINVKSIEKSQCELRLGELASEVQVLTNLINVSVGHQSIQITDRIFRSGQLAFTHGTLRAFGAQMRQLRLDQESEEQTLELIKSELSDLARRKAALENLCDRRKEEYFTWLEKRSAREIDELFAARGHYGQGKEVEQ